MSKKILLADDSVTIQKVITITFASEDYELEVVGDGTAAIAKAKEFLPDIILADVAMPGKTGYEVSEAIKSDSQLKHIPVLLLAGTFEPLDEGEAARVMSDGCIVKPFESQELIDKVAGLLGKAAGPAGGGVAEEAADGGFEVPEDIWSEGDFAGISEEFDDKAGLSEEDSSLPALDFLESGGFLGEDESEDIAPEAPEAAPAPPVAPTEAQSTGFVGLEDIKPEGSAEELPSFGAEAEEPLKVAPLEVNPSAEESAPYEIEHLGEVPEPGLLGREEPALAAEAEPAAEKDAEAEVAELLDFSDEPVSFARPEAPQPDVAEEPQAAARPAETFQVPELELELEPELEIEEPPAPSPVVEAAVEKAAAKATEEVASRIPDAGLMDKEQIEEVVKKVAREVIEKIAWDVVPELAQERIDAEISRFRKAWGKPE